MAISKVASRRLLCCILALYVYMPRCCFLNVNDNHEIHIFDRLYVIEFLKLLNLQNASLSFFHKFSILHYIEC